MSEPHIDIVAQLKPVFNAAYDCGPRANSRCLEGTRVEVVREIDDWANSPGNRHLCLLDGPAGFGKSAIARTVADRWNVSKRLAGTFFFFRNSGDQSKGVRLVPTLSYQLTLCMPETKKSIENALIDDPSLLNRPLERQFQKLIIDPVLTLPNPKLIQFPMRIVVDGLDECDDHDFIRQLIDTIIRIDYSKFPVDFLFTSRREEHIRKIFESSPFSHSVSLSNTAFNVRGDIEHFLRSKFSAIYEESPRLMEDIRLPWPSPQDLDEIAGKVNGSFIFAFTLTKYIGEGREPPQRLKLIVETHNGVDDMYTEIVQQFWKDEHFPIVFSTIMLLRTPLSIAGLASLLNLTVPEILIEIFKVQSILVIPADNKTPVDVVHTSLREFSVSKKRSGALFVNSPQNHLITAEHCLEVMSKQSGVVVFKEEAAKYASEHWHDHLRHALEDPDSKYDMTVLNHFVEQSFKTWFNTVLIMFWYDQTRDALEAIIQKAKVSPPFVQT